MVFDLYFRPTPSVETVAESELTEQTGSTAGRSMFHTLGSNVINPVIKCVDVNGVMRMIDVNDLMQRVDWNELADDIDWNNIMEHIDVDAVMQRIDVNAVVERVDVSRSIALSPKPYQQTPDTRTYCS